MKFLKKWLGGSEPSESKDDRRLELTLPPELLRKLALLIHRCFNESELQELCHDLAVDYDSLAAQGKQGKVREMVLFFERSARTGERNIDELVQACVQRRPKAPWDAPVVKKYPPYPHVGLIRLRHALTDHFTESDIRTIGETSQVEWVHLPGTGLEGIARELALYLARRERLDELVRVCAQHQPDVPWQEILNHAESQPISPKVQARPIDLPKLRRTLETHLGEEEMRDLCFEISVGYEDLPGSNKALELVALSNRRGRLGQLTEACARLHPNVPWGFV